MFVVYFAITIINGDNRNTESNSHNEMKISIIIGLIHLIWWSVYFAINKRKKD